jgi:polysaccharide deacetylase family protein (PEP-CTERM system associated)
MNILTFDIEDWYNCDFISSDFDWDKHEVRIYESVDRILNELGMRNLKATFFCLGWLAEKHPGVIRKIHDQGHHIGCHSYQHELSYRFDRKSFKEDTLKAKSLIENVIGEPVDAFRAPGFSITEKNLWALEVLCELGFLYDCSIFSGQHDYGGLPNFGESTPTLIRLPNGSQIKEFPMTTKKIYGKKVVFSGGGFFRIIPYSLIKKWGYQSTYLITYFHPRDFDEYQPIIKSLPIIRRFKSYYGIKGAFSKFRKLLDDFTFVSVLDADNKLDWNKARIVDLEDLFVKKI